MIRNRSALVAVPVVTVAGLALGTVGYLQAPGWEGKSLGWEDAAFRSLQLLFLNYDSAAADPPSTTLRIARWLLAAVALALVGVVVFFAVLTEEARRRIAARRLNNHILVITAGDWAADIIRSLHGESTAHGGSRLAVLTPGPSVLQDAMSGTNIRAWPGSGEDQEVLKAVRVHRARNVVIALDDDAASMRAAAAVRAAVAGGGRSAPLGVVCLFRSALRTRALLLEGAGQTSAEVSIEFFSPVETGVSLVVEHLAKTRSWFADHCRGVILVGDGEILDETLLRLAAEARNRESTLPVTVVAPVSAARCEALMHRHRGLGDHLVIRAEEMHHLVRVVAGAAGTSVVVCADAGLGALETALEVLEVGTQEQRVDILSAGGGGETDFAGTSGGMLSRLDVHSVHLRALTPSVLLNSRRERLARELHELWRQDELRKAAGGEDSRPARPWEELSDDGRLSSRAAADGLVTLMGRLGFSVVPDPLIDPDYEFSIEPELVERGAIIEHERWCAQKLRDGYALGPTVAGDARKEHASLIPYEQLDWDEQEKDRNFVRSAPRLLAAVGLRVQTGAGAAQNQ